MDKTYKSYMSYKSNIDSYLEKHGFEALRPKAVLFDMDGVLYDSMPNHAIAWQKSMEEFGLKMTRDDAYATEGQRGVDTIRQLMERQNGRIITEEEAQEMYNRKSKIFHDMPDPPMMPGAKELMGQIFAQGLRIAVVTGSAQKPLLSRMESDYGAFLVNGTIVNARSVNRGKPFPDPYLKALDEMGIPNPWEAIVVENAPLGVQAGVAANIFTICVNTGKLPVQLFEQKGANMILPSMLALNKAWPVLSRIFFK